MIISRKRVEPVKVFKSAEAFYRYLEQKLASQGYVLVETCPILKTKINSGNVFSEASELERRRG